MVPERRARGEGAAGGGGRRIEAEADVDDAVGVAVGVLGGGSVAGGGERGGRIGQVAAPEGEALAEDTGVLQLALPGGEVGVLDSGAGQAGPGALADGQVGLGEFVLEDVEGPPVGDDVVHAEHQRRTAVVDADEPAAHQAAPVQVERASAEGVEGLVDAGAGAAQVVALQDEGAAVGEVDAEFAAGGLGDPGAQDVVVLLDEGERALQVGGVHGVFEVIGTAQVEGGGAGIQRLVRPQVLLRGAEPDRPGGVPPRDDGGHVPHAAALHQLAQQLHALLAAERAEAVGEGGGGPRSRTDGGGHDRLSFSSASRFRLVRTSSRPRPKSTKQATSSTPSSARSASILAQWPGEPSRLPQLR